MAYVIGLVEAGLGIISETVASVAGETAGAYAANAVKGTVVAGAVGTAKEYGAEAVDYTFGQGSSQKGVNNLSKAEQIRQEMKTGQSFRAIALSKDH